MCVFDSGSPHFLRECRNFAWSRWLAALTKEAFSLQGIQQKLSSFSAFILAHSTTKIKITWNPSIILENFVDKASARYVRDAISFSTTPEEQYALLKGEKGPIGPNADMCNVERDRRHEGGWYFDREIRADMKTVGVSCRLVAELAIHSFR